MGSKELLAWIGEASSEEAKAIVTKAQRKAATIIEEGAAECERTTLQVRGEYEQAADQERRRILASQRVMARREVMECKEGLIRQVFVKARTNLADLTEGPGYPETLVRLVVEGAAALGGGPLTVRVRPTDVDLLKNKAPAIETAVSKAVERNTSIKVVASDRPLVGGAVVATEDGKRRVNNSLMARMAAQEEELRAIAARELFGGWES